MRGELSNYIQMKQQFLSIQILSRSIPRRLFVQPAMFTLFVFAVSFHFMRCSSAAGRARVANLYFVIPYLIKAEQANNACCALINE